MNMRGIHLKGMTGKSNVITKAATKMLGCALSIEKYGNTGPGCDALSIQKV
jgi:hypothetical protein